MRVCFFGSEQFSIPSLKALIENGHEICAVITRSDKVKGRGLEETPTIVSDFAIQQNIPVLKPEDFKDGIFAQLMLDYKPDINIVCAYGKILNTGILACPLKGCINVHPSLLPKYRGATPIESALRAGDTETGVTIFYMDEGCDTGDIILQKTYPISEEDNRVSLREKLSVFSAEVLIEAVDMIKNDKVKRMPQPKEGLCNTSLIKKEDLFINWNNSMKDIINFARSLSPLPGVKTVFRGKLIGISALKIFETDKKGAPGTILDVIKNVGPVVAAGDGALTLTAVKPEGKKCMDTWCFCCGNSPKIGEKFGE